MRVGATVKLALAVAITVALLAADTAFAVRIVARRVGGGRISAVRISARIPGAHYGSGSTSSRRSRTLNTSSSRDSRISRPQQAIGANQPSGDRRLSK